MNRTPTERASRWLEQFGSAVAAPDVRGAAAQFHAESYWRDLVSFTWNIKTMEGADEIGAMLGATDPYDPIPSFWSDQFSYKLRYRGYAPQWESLVFRGDRDAGSFSAFYIAQGVVEAVCSVNRYGENYSSQRLIGKHVEPRVLQDDEINVKEIEIR